jgi:hypothetical protein
MEILNFALLSLFFMKHDTEFVFLPRANVCQVVSFGWWKVFVFPMRFSVVEASFSP